MDVSTPKFNNYTSNDCIFVMVGNDTLVTTRKPFTTRYTTTEAESDEEEHTTRSPHNDKYKDSGNY